MTDRFDDTLVALLAREREIEPAPDELEHVLKLHRRARSRPSKRPRRRLMAALIAAVALVGVCATPPTRAALDDIYTSFAPWLRDGDDARAPGRALTVERQIPGWLRQQPGQKRELADVGGVKLIASRGPGDTFTLAIGDSFGRSSTLDDWREFLGPHAVSLVGPGDHAPNEPFDSRGRRPLFGIASASVAKVELRYEFGPSISDDDVDGGFGLLVDATRRLRVLVAYDDQGRQLERRDMTSVDLRICKEVRGCPPGRLLPHRVHQPQS
jgi:hypothetical protein